MNVRCDSFGPDAGADEFVPRSARCPIRTHDADLGLGPTCEPENHEELCVQHGQGQHRMEQTQYMDVVETLFC